MQKKWKRGKFSILSLGFLAYFHGEKKQLPDHLYDGNPWIKPTQGRKRRSENSRRKIWPSKITYGYIILNRKTGEVIEQRLDIEMQGTANGLPMTGGGLVTYKCTL